MKLHTSIKKRRDGTVRATASNGHTFEFVANAVGELECDVTDAALVARLLATEQFWPADENDFSSAESLIKGGHDDTDDDEDDILLSQPVEALTPPKPKPAKKVRGKAE